MFVDVSAERRSKVWKDFLLDKEESVAKCKICDANKIIKILRVTNGNTKSLLEHLEHVHGPSNPKNVKTGKGNIDNYLGRKSLGETVSKLAIDGITFRCIAESKILREAFTVSNIL